MSRSGGPQGDPRLQEAREVSGGVKTQSGHPWRPQSALSIFGFFFRLKNALFGYIEDHIEIATHVCPALIGRSVAEHFGGSEDDRIVPFAYNCFGKVSDTTSEAVLTPNLGQAV